MQKRKICFVTTSRADYGLLISPIGAVDRSKSLELQLVVSGMHLAPEFGMTVREIELDGWPIDARVEMLLSSDTAVGVGKSIGLGTIGFVEAFDRLAPDLVVLLGDRFEMLAAGSAALISRLPVAHLCGGDTTEGAFDEAIRHSLTKMSHLHFVTNSDAKRRVEQLGEAPDCVHQVGSTGLDVLLNGSFPPKPTLAVELNLDAAKPWLLVTFHPVTLEGGSSDQINSLLEALEEFPDCEIIFTQPNADTEGRALFRRLSDWSDERRNVRVFSSLGQQRYLGCMKHSAAVVGNSSSGLYEAPSFSVPTVNIGIRQQGRMKAASVTDCAPSAPEISQAIRQAVSAPRQSVANPYGDGRSAERIIEILEATPDYRALLLKRFHDVRTK